MHLRHAEQAWPAGCAAPCRAGWCLLAGPGCPVCVCPWMRARIALAAGATVYFGDMLRVPGG